MVGANGSVNLGAPGARSAPSWSQGRVRLFDTDTAAFRQWWRVEDVPQRAAADSTLPISVDEVVRTGLAGQLHPGRRATRHHRQRIETCWR